MKNIVLFAVAMVFAALLCSCRESKTNQDNYIQTIEEGLLLSETPVPEVVAMEIPEGFLKYAGTFIDDVAELYFNPRANNAEECGYFFLSGNYEQRYTLKLVNNEPSPSGFNHVLMEIFDPDNENIGRIDGIIEGRGDGFHGKILPKSGGTVEFKLMQQYK